MLPLPERNGGPPGAPAAASTREVGPRPRDAPAQQLPETSHGQEVSAGDGACAGGTAGTLQSAGQVSDGRGHTLGWAVHTKVICVCVFDSRSLRICSPSPLSSVQSGLWLQMRLNGESPTFATYDSTTRPNSFQASYGALK